MDCKEFRELLDLYVDGELSPEASLSAQTHLEECFACRRVERQLALLRRSVKRAVNEHEPPAELMRKVSEVTRPAWLRWLTSFSTGRQPGPVGAGTTVSFWRRKIAVPAPACALLLIMMLALGGLLISTHTTAPTPNQSGVRKVPPAPAPPATIKEFDLTQFDRGARAAIYKVRLAGQKEQEP